MSEEAATDASNKSRSRNNSRTSNNRPNISRSSFHSNKSKTRNDIDGSGQNEETGSGKNVSRNRNKSVKSRETSQIISDSNVKSRETSQIISDTNVKSRETLANVKSREMSSPVQNTNRDERSASAPFGLNSADHIAIGSEHLKRNQSAPVSDQDRQKIRSNMKNETECDVYILRNKSSANDSAGVDANIPGDDVQNEEDWEALAKTVRDDNYQVHGMNFNSKERAFTDEEFIDRLNKDRLMLSVEVDFWRKKYKLDEDEFKKGTEAILDGSIDLADEGLTDNEMKDVRSKLRTLKNLPLPELLDYVRLCTFD